MALLKLDAEADGSALVATVRTSNASHQAVFSRATHTRIYLRSKAICSRVRFVIAFWVIDAQGDCCSRATTPRVPQLMAFAGVSTRKRAIVGRGDPRYGPSTHIAYRCDLQDTRVARLLQLVRAKSTALRTTIS